MELRVQHLDKAFAGRSVLRDVNFTAGPGLTCIMGPSGEGKTTLLRIILGLEQPDRGQVLGREHIRFSAVFQEDRLLPQLDSEGNLRFVLGRAYDPQSAAKLLQALGMPDTAGKPVREFSGGMRRRLALARALLVPFDALLLDEPFAGLDAENRRRAMSAIRRYADGKVVLLVTHDSADAQNASVVQL